MNDLWATPCRCVPLKFRSHDELDHASDPVRSDLSAVALLGDCLWVANDGFAAVERLIVGERGIYENHERFHFGDAFELPAGPQGPMDIEGMDADGGWLWAVGSHSLVRGKADPDAHTAHEAFARLSDLIREPNRYFLGRVPLVAAGGNWHDLRPKVAADTDGRERRAACLPFDQRTSRLEELLSDDPHIGPSVTAASKENGFDIEGLAARGDRVFLGLRGPVLGRWAVVLELKLRESQEGVLEPEPIGRDGRAYRKHFLHLDGLGLRDLCFDGADLLLLAGPTMDVDWPVVLYRWRDCLHTPADSVIPLDRLEQALLLPWDRVKETAEGVAVLRHDGERTEILVVYDPPRPQRRHDDGAGVDADAFLI